MPKDKYGQAEFVTKEEQNQKMKENKQCLDMKDERKHRMLEIANRADSHHQQTKSLCKNQKYKIS